MTKGLLKNKVALITGASRGLGANITRTFGNAGAHLILIGRNSERLNSLRQTLVLQAGQQAICFAGDVCDEDFATKVMTIIQQQFGCLNILVNNAAIQGPIGPFWENDWKAWHHTLHVDLLAPIYWTRLAVPLLKMASPGKVINLSGGGATNARANFSAYALAKTALVRFTEIAALELASDAIDINAIAPGAMNTDMVKEILQASVTQVGERDYQAAERVQHDTEDAVAKNAAKLALFLACSQSNGITGKLISAQWDDWQNLPQYKSELQQSDIYTLRRIIPKDRGFSWGDNP